MPIKDDLILRMLDQIAEAVARVAFGRGRGDIAEAEHALAEAYQHLAGSSRALVARLSPDELLAILGAPTGFNRERGYVLGKLLQADAELRLAAAGLRHGLGAPSSVGGAPARGDGPTVAAADRPAAARAGTYAAADGASEAVDGAADAAAEAAPARLQALDLFVTARAAGLEEEDLDDLVDAQVAALRDVLLPASSHWRLFEDRVAIGRFDEAEDLLFEGAERFGPRPDVVRRGRAFYRELAGLDAGVLERGNLPRDEVEEGRRAFEASIGGVPGGGGAGA